MKITTTLPMKFLQDKQLRQPRKYMNYLLGFSFKSDQAWQELPRNMSTPENAIISGVCRSDKIKTDFIGSFLAVSPGQFIIHTKNSIHF